MPEGDTLHRTAARLRPALVGGRVTRFDAPRLRGDRPRRDVRVDDVEARGKNLLVHFDDGLTLRTHLRMTGSWHIYRTGERWRQSPGKARVVIEVDTGWMAVCFAAPVVETYRRGGPEPAPLARLGPDLCRDDADLDAVVERWTALATAADEVGVLLLDQRIAAGIGNVYRCEVLFANGIDPFTPAAALDPAAVRRLYATAHRMLRANLATDRRRTTNERSSGAAPSTGRHAAGESGGVTEPSDHRGETGDRGGVAESSISRRAAGEGGGAVLSGGRGDVGEGDIAARSDRGWEVGEGGGGAMSGGRRGVGEGGDGSGLHELPAGLLGMTTVGGPRSHYAVYGRPGRPCLRCGTPVRTRRQGEQARSVYWCPTCQVRP